MVAAQVFTLMGISVNRRRSFVGIQRIGPRAGRTRSLDADKALALTAIRSYGCTDPTNYSTIPPEER